MYASSPTSDGFWVKFDFVDIHGIMLTDTRPPTTVFDSAYFHWRAQSRTDGDNLELCHPENFGLLKFEDDGLVKIRIVSKFDTYNREYKLKRSLDEKLAIGSAVANRRKIAQLESWQAEWNTL